MIKLIPVPMDSKHSGLLRLLLLQALIPICLSSSAAFMANEFFPASADGQQHSNGGATTAAPTEEDLIARLLKGPGLPPGGPPIGGEVPPSAADDRNGADKSKQNSQMPSTTLPPLPPADNSLPVLGFSKSASHGLPPSAPPSYIQCLYQVAARVCDVDNILQSQERTEIDETLRQLEAATRKENAANECERSGLKLMIILVRHSALLEDPMNSVQKKLNDALGLWVREPEHKCDKPVVLMLSADPQMVNRKVWTGRHWDVPVPPSEMVQLFMAQEDLTRKEKYGAVILNILDGLLSKYEQRALGGGEGKGGV